MKLRLGGKHGGYAIVSPKDHKRLSEYTWRKNDEGYVTGEVDGVGMSMHHLVYGAEYQQKVDHINGIRHDNRIENLRLSNSLLNGQNKHMDKTGCSSQYVGVNLHGKKYSSHIMLNHVLHNLGHYDNEVDAAVARDMFIVHSKLDHIPLNFPDKREEYLLKEYIPFQPKIPKQKYTGVQERNNGSYYVTVSIGRVTNTVGTFKDIIEAAKAFDEYVVNNNLFGRKLNFPDQYPDYVNKKLILTFCEPIDDVSVKLLLNDGKYLIIDKSEYDKVKYYACGITPKGYGTIRVDGIDLRLSRFLTGETDPLIYVDHIDRNTLNNRLANLRKSNCKKNPQNRTKQKGLTSKYMGVHYNTNGQIWIGRIKKDGKLVFHIKLADEEAVARAHDLFIIDHLKDDHYGLNFKWSDDDIIAWKQKLDVMTKLVNKSNSNSSSKYAGVSYSKKIDKWVAKVARTEQTRSFYHECSTEEAAARSRDLFVLFNRKDSGMKFNFIWSDDDIEKWNAILKIKKN
ncbi:MAG: hypothetical protein Barrevirus1_5 [Barrevirus sp.]|uniref:AP2/ERF domain-containing protein n=1 Tax=Barrevirus sp. TaxID=2487763 RepID=A0A3G4ZT49_9VIRU|nr:MAG: hypothetical protein Barrevirus1_5 [Barrevirus sp.]